MDRVTEYFGLTEDGKCDKCGHNIFQMVMHLDLDDEAQTTYKCMNCGNEVLVVEPREENYYGE